MINALSLSASVPWKTKCHWPIFLVYPPNPSSSHIWNSNPSKRSPWSPAVKLNSTLIQSLSLPLLYYCTSSLLDCELLEGYGWPLNHSLKFFFFLSLFILRGKQHEQRRGRERRERISSRLHAVSTEPDVGLDLRNHEIMTWAEIQSEALNQLSHPGAPRRLYFKWRLKSD